MFFNHIKFILIILFCSLNFINSEKRYKIDGREYISSYPLKKNWYQAFRYCTYFGTELADVSSAEEDERLIGIAQDIKIPVVESGFWISGTDLGSEGNFYWMNSGHPIVYSNFIPGQPDNWNNEDHCLEYTANNIATNGTVKWNDAVCTSQRYFICRKINDNDKENNNCGGNIFGAGELDDRFGVPVNCL